MITIVQKERPSENMIELCYDQNDAGAGIAWREKDMVHWVKGLDLPEIKKLCANRPLPYVAHFRIPTCGGSVKQLCHPFPIHKDCSLALEGTIKGSVLFHNGHWGAWKDHVITAAVKGHLQLPKGKWSDSRAMAWISAHYGLGMLELIDEKAVAFGPDDMEIIGMTGVANGWVYVNDIWCSNRAWERTNYDHTSYNTKRWNDHKEWDVDLNKWVDKKKSPELKALPAGEADRRLPAHYIDTGAGIDKLPVPLMGDDKKEQAGGTVSETPFEQALRLWEAGTLSKKQWKKAQKRHSKELRKVGNAILAGKHVPLKDGVIVH